MKMDHHCPWVGNCVGFKNHKYFWNFLLHSLIGCILAFIDLATFVYYKGMHYLVRNSSYGSATMAMSGALCLSLGGLFIIHTYFLLHNSSTLEAN
mmetsp:Transcript_110093/g.152324  ORF Transcript_110093/g.152324 Transcript_110093/m.152324 type:complete len:95 (+) Transcript_110093:709-993(+)